ncbi:MAG TPA: hypothetical protein VGZ48_06600, partial [Candidatus Acidoferrales bacterium]|nr:hypothetical protein [Candidatus Acidoferrales bacterium]
VERPLAFYKNHARGYHAPRDHDSRDPHARPKLFQEHIAGNFKEEITDEENARTSRERRIAHGKFLEHLQFRKTNVDPIEISQNVAEEEEWKQPNVYLVVCRRF